MDELAVRMTAKVINDVAADILCVVEAEDRPSLARFNDELLDRRYGHAMLVDGNAPAASTSASTPRPHRHRLRQEPRRRPRPGQPGRPLFSHDCPVYQVRLPDGKDLFLLFNHLKSQSFSSGNPDPLRSRQCQRVRDIYDQLRADGADLIAVLGDLNKGPTNDTPPKHPTLEPLLGLGTPSSTPPHCPSSTPDHDPARSSRAACATDSTTSSCPPNSPNAPPQAASTAPDSGATPTTSTHHRTGTSTPRSPPRDTPHRTRDCKSLLCQAEVGRVIVASMRRAR
ncbi:hypothetical protein AB0H12_44860 [Actinosynnema sp. NPDC023794]